MAESDVAVCVEVERLVARNENGTVVDLRAIAMTGIPQFKRARANLADLQVACGSVVFADSDGNAVVGLAEMADFENIGAGVVESPGIVGEAAIRCLERPELQDAVAEINGSVVSGVAFVY